MKNIAKKAVGISLLAGTLGVSGYAATPDWSVTDAGDGKVTYSITQAGAFTFDDLGVAAIKNGESFSLEVEVTAPTFANEWGTGIIGTADPYSKNGTADNFMIYVGSGTQNDRKKVELYINNWSYGMANVSYLEKENESDPLVFKFKIEFVNAGDASDGNDYISFSSLSGSSVTFDEKIDYNVVGSFNFSKLTNEGSQFVPDGTVTKVWITKAGVVPEPSAFGLIAGAGALALVVARRRRRKA